MLTVSTPESYRGFHGEAASQAARRGAPLPPRRPAPGAPGRGAPDRGDGGDGGADVTGGRAGGRRLPGGALPALRQQGSHPRRGRGGRVPLAHGDDAGSRRGERRPAAGAAPGGG